jgi:uncharacterized protein (TIRG00374 family)
VGAGCLFWLFHNLPIVQLFESMACVHGWLLAPAALLALAAYLCVAWEWQLLLRPLGTLPFWRAAQAVFAGRFANDSLPVHVGYVVRAFLASRWLGVSLAATAPSLIVERLWDGFWLATGTGLLSLFISLPPELVRARNALALTVLAGVAATAAVILYLRRRIVVQPAEADHARKGAATRARFLIQCVGEGTRDIVHSPLFAAVLSLALLRLAVQAVAILVLLRAFDIELSLAAGLVVFVAGYMAGCVPSLPAGTGLFQLFVVAVLECFGVGKTLAASFSLVSFVTLTAPPALAGFVALAHSGLTLRQIRQEAGNLEILTEGN